MAHLIHVGPLPFEPGDRLSREEFLARWEKMPQLKFADLIYGVVYTPSPISYDHGHLDSQMAMVLGVYAARTPGCEVVSNATWLMLESAPQPDIAMRLLPESGGRTYISGGLAAGAPELVVDEEVHQ